MFYFLSNNYFIYIIYITSGLVFKSELIQFWSQNQNIRSAGVGIESESESFIKRSAGVGIESESESFIKRVLESES